MELRNAESAVTDALLQAHRFADLAGEIAPPELAMLRLLLAVLHTVFCQEDARGAWRR